MAATDAPKYAAATCAVEQLVCGNTTLLSLNPNVSVCGDSQNTRNYDCVSVCKKAGYVCTCSADRMGKDCSKWRPYTCSFNLKSPQPDCKPNNVVDSDPICFVYKREQTVTFTYTIDCSFDEPPIGDEPDEFKYFLRSSKFAVSEEQTKLWPLEVQLKVFDFKWLSDRTATQVTNLTAAQLAGNDTVSFSLDFQHIPDNFYAGNRLYFEFGLSRASNVRERTIKYDRRFIDFENLHIHRSTHSTLGTIAISWIVGGSVCGAALLVVVCYWLWDKIISCRRPKEHDY